MIARLWRGRVSINEAGAYREFLRRRAIPDHQSVAGNISLYILERHEGDIAPCVTLAFWEDMGTIQSFAGTDVERVKYYPEDRGYRLEFEPGVVRYRVVGRTR